MKNYLIIIILLISTSLIAQEQMVSPAAPAGMRGVPSNIPDISVVGDFYGKVSNNETDTERNKLIIREIELGLQGYIYPEMRADVFLAMHKHEELIEPEICEAYVSFLNLFGGIGLKVGKIHVDFGKVNKVHQHHRPYVDQPQVITNFLGDHGLVGEGISLSYLFPLPFFAQFDLGAWRVPEHHHHDDEENHEEEFSLADEVYTSRLWLSFPLNEKSELEIGASGVTGKGSHYTHHQDDVQVLGMDLTYKFWPSTFSRWIFQNEILYILRDVPIGRIKRIGFYNYLGYKFNKYWQAGIRYDDAKDVLPHEDANGNPSAEISEKTKSASAVVTRNLTETTSMRLHYKYYFEGPKDVHEGYFQILFGIGPHSHLLE